MTLRITTAIAVLLLVACAREAQTYLCLGSVTTSVSAETVAELAFVDNGRWTLFMFQEKEPANAPWPASFRAEILDRDGKVVLSRVVDDAVPESPSDGRGLLAWRIDTLRAPFEANLDAQGQLPVDRVLRNGERYVLRITLPAAPARGYDVFLLSNRKVYPWQEN